MCVYVTITAVAPEKISKFMWCCRILYYCYRRIYHHMIFYFIFFLSIKITEKKVCQKDRTTKTKDTSGELCCVCGR